MKQLLDSTIAIALTTAFFYVIGFSYYTTYLFGYRLPLSLFLPPPQEVVSKGFSAAYIAIKSLWVLALIVTGIAMGIYLGVQRLSRNRFASLRVSKVATAISRFRICFRIYLPLIGAFWLANYLAASLGHADAVRTRTVATVILKEPTETIRGRFVAYADGTYAILVGKEVKIIRTEDARVVTIEPAVQVGNWYP